MKLSEKGMLKLRSFVTIMNNFNVTTEDIEFEPEDFKDVVVLTVEEAEYALKVVRFAITTCEAVNEHKDKLWNLASLLHRRIKQAEGKR